MTLLVDVGNSNICFGFANNDKIVDTFRIKSFLDRSYDEYYLIINNFIKYDINDGGNTTIRKDNWGFGAVVGNRLTDNIKIEFETMYTGAKQTKRDTNFDFDVWANMLNVHLFQEYADAVAPYVGMGIGFATVWGNVSNPNMSDSVFGLSYSAMIGVNFVLNDRIDLNLGVKYQFYGTVEHKIHNARYAQTDIDATEFYFGAVYKFGL